MTTMMRSKTKTMLLIMGLMSLFVLILASCSAQTVRLSFDTNGGNRITAMEVEQRHVFGSLPTPTRIGYTFEGWFQEPDLSTPFNANEPLMRNRIIYAKWSINQYTITFETFGGSTIAPLVRDYQSTIEAPTVPEKEGHDFAGWFTSESYDIPYQFTSMPAEDVTVYARWAIHQHTVAFYVDDQIYTWRNVSYGSPITNVPTVPEKAGMTGQWSFTDFSSITNSFNVYAEYAHNYYTVEFVDQWGVVYDTQSVRHGHYSVTPELLPLKEGYDFLGYSVDVETTPILGDIEIIVDFRIKTFTVRFFGDLGTPLDEIYVDWNHAADAPVVSVREGYQFIGWSTDFSNVTSNLDVVATITPIDYEIVLDAGLGYFSDEQMTKVITSPYESVVGVLETPLRFGYTFMGWYDNDSFEGNPVVFSAQSTMPLNGITLYAAWEANTHTVTFDALGGVVSPSSKQITFGTAIGALPTPIKTGYDFAGWINELGLAVTSSTAFAFDGDTTFTATWTIKTHTVTYTVDGSVYLIQTYDYGTLLTSADIPTIPIKTHYTDTAPLWSDDLEAMQITGDMTVTAMYTPNHYTITFNGQGGTTPTSITQAYLSLLDDGPVPINDGYSFGGWYTDIDFTEQHRFIFDTMPGGDMTLYAKWTQWPTITLNLQGGVGVTLLSQAPNAELSEPVAPTKTGYSFSGWFSDDSLTVPYTFSTMPEEDLTIYAAWDPAEVQYTVEIYRQNTDGTYSVLPTTKHTLNALTGSTVTFTPESIEGFSLHETLNVLSGTVLADGSLILTVIYERHDVQLTLYYQDSDDPQNETVMTFTLLYGALLSLLENHPNAREGYQFNGWIDGSGQPFDVNSPITEDLELFAQWAIKRYQVSGQHIFLRENLDTGVLEVDADPMPFQRLNLAYGTLLLPMMNFEGYTFLKFVYDGVEYFSIEDYLLVNANLSDVDVYYTRKIVTINFLQNKAEAGYQSSGEHDPAIIVDTFRLYYNESWTETLPEIIITDPAYFANWDRTVFNFVKDNIEVRAIYYQSGLQTVTFNDGGAIRYIAANTTDAPNQILTEDSLLWQLTKPGYRFEGWFTSPTGGTPLAIEELTFSNFTGSVVLYAQWVAIETFNTPTDVTLQVGLDGTITIGFNLEPGRIEGQLPSEVDVLFNGMLIEDVLSKFSYVVSENDTHYTITITPTDEDYSWFSMIVLPGVHSLSVRVNGDDLHHRSSTFSTSITYTVDADIEGDVTDVATYDYFIVESIEINGVATKRYVFYANMTYNFSDRYHFEIIHGHSVIDANGNALSTANSHGNFRFSMSVDGGTPIVYEGRVVANINQFTAGSYYMTYLNETSGNDYLKSAITPYQVGSKNPYHFDLRIINNSGERIDIDETMLLYSFYLNGSETALTTEELSTYVAFVDAHRIQFTSAAEGHTFRVVIKPRYQATMMQVNDVEFEMEVNNGYNAFTNTQLQTLFKDLSVNSINIHANIEAALASNQKNSDGSPRNLAGNPQTGNIYGNVYGRASDSTANDQLTIHGNYMTIDGSNLPYSNRTSGSGVLGYSAAFEVINVQIAMFYYDVYDAVTINGVRTIPAVNNNQFMMNNLTVLGNTTTPSINYGQSAEEIANQEQLMSRNSGGYNGIMIRNGSSTLTNLRLGYMLIPLFNTAYGSQSDAETVPVIMTVNEVKTYDSWANSVYLHGATGIHINRSSIGQSGGAAIHMVDRRQGSGIANPTLMIDEETEINNWISGEEAWFKAYAMSVVALQLKSQIQQGLAPLGKSIIKEIINPVTGLPTEMINFIMLTEPSKGAQDDDINPTTGSEYYLNLSDHQESYIINRPFDFFSQGDPRIQGGGFMFAVSQLSSTTSFMSAIAEGMGYGLSQGDAVNIAYIAGFYNLSVSNAMQVAGTAQGYGVSLSAAVDMVMGEHHLRPKYLEILYNVPIFTAGYSNVMVEVFDQK